MSYDPTADTGRAIRVLTIRFLTEQYQQGKHDFIGVSEFPNEIRDQVAIFATRLIDAGRIFAQGIPPAWKINPDHPDFPGESDVSKPE